MPVVSPSPGCVLQFLAPSSPEEPAVRSEGQLQPQPTPGEQLEVYPESATWDLVMAGVGTALLGGGILVLLLTVSGGGGAGREGQPMPQRGCRRGAEYCCGLCSRNCSGSMWHSSSSCSSRYSSCSSSRRCCAHAESPGKVSLRSPGSWS